MRKYLLLHTLIISIIFLSTPIIHSAEEVKDRLLVIPFKAKGGINQDEVALLTDILSIEIYRSGKFTMLNRDDMKAILDEKEFELAMGCDDNVCLLENVAKLAVNKIITGNIGKLGTRYIVSIRMINEDGENEVMERDYCDCQLAELTKSIERVAYKFLRYLGDDVVQDGSIRVESEPRGAKIFLDGDNIGTTPDSIRRIVPGTHKVEVKMDGYRVWSEKVDVEAGEEEIITAKLQKQSASINVKSKPASAEIYIGGHYSGTTPKTITDLESGLYNVEVKKNGYREWSKRVNVETGEEISILAKLVQYKPRAYTDPASVLTPEEFEQCRQIYFDRCTGCHGVLRKGATGPNLTPAKTIPKGTKKLRDFIWYGTGRGMPGWGKMGVMTADETDLMVKYIQNEPPIPPQWDMTSVRASWKLLIPPDKRPTRPEHNRDIDNMFIVVLRDAGQVAIIDGDTKEVISTVDSGYAVHIVRMSMSGRYAYTIGRDGKATMIDLWMKKPDTVAEIRCSLDARSIAVSKFKGFEDKYAVVGGYWPPQFVILDGSTLEPIKIESTLGYTYDTEEFHPEPRVASIVASHFAPEWLLSVKETGKVWLVNYSDPNNPGIKKIEAERFLHDGGWDSTKRYFLVAANARNKISIIDAKEQKLVANVDTGGIKPHPGRGANWVDPEFGPVWATGHIGDDVISLIGTDPVGHPEYAFKMVAKVQALSSGNLFIKTHPKSKWVWVDHPISKKEKNRTTLGIFDKANIKGGIFKTLKVADYGRAVHMEYNKAGDELWVSIWGNLGDAGKGMAGEIVVIDDATLRVKARIKNLLTPTGKFNVYNTVHDIY